jgi:hypothetical protein
MSKTYLKSDHFNGGGSADAIAIAFASAARPCSVIVTRDKSYVQLMSAGRAPFGLARPSRTSASKSSAL